MAILAHSNQSQHRSSSLSASWNMLEDREANCLTLAGRLTTSTGEASACRHTNAPTRLSFALCLSRIQQARPY